MWRNVHIRQVIQRCHLSVPYLVFISFYFSFVSHCDRSFLKVIHLLCWPAHHVSLPFCNFLQFISLGIRLSQFLSGFVLKLGLFHTYHQPIWRWWHLSSVAPFLYVWCVFFLLLSIIGHFDNKTLGSMISCESGCHWFARRCMLLC